MAETVFRRMNFMDIDRVLTVEREAFSTPWSRNAFEEEMSNNELAYYLVAELDGTIIGYAGMWIIVDEGHITNIAMLERYRGQGIGTLLVKKLMDIAVMRGVESMTLEVRVSNTAARAFYGKLGFVGRGIRRGYYTDNKEDALIMWYERKGASNASDIGN